MESLQNMSVKELENFIKESNKQKKNISRAERKKAMTENDEKTKQALIQLITSKNTEPDKDELSQEEQKEYNRLDTLPKRVASNNSEDSLKKIAESLNAIPEKGNDATKHQFIMNIIMARKGLELPYGQSRKAKKRSKSPSKSLEDSDVFDVMDNEIEVVMSPEPEKIIKKGENKQMSGKKITKQELITALVDLGVGTKDKYRDWDTKALEQRLTAHLDAKGQEISRSEVIKALIALEVAEDPSFFSSWSHQELIDQLNLALGPKESSRQDAIQTLIEFGVADNPSYFDSWSDVEINQRLDAVFHENDEEERIQLMFDIGATTGEDLGKYKDWSLQELSQKKESLKMLFSRDEKITKISEWTKRSPDDYQDWTNDELDIRLEGLKLEKIHDLKKKKQELIQAIRGYESKADGFLRNYGSKAERNLEKQSYSDLDKKLRALDETHQAKYQEGTEVTEVVEDQVIDEKSDSSDDEAEIPSPEKVEMLLQDIVSGKQTNTDQFTKVQQAVLRCLGLISA